VITGGLVPSMSRILDWLAIAVGVGVGLVFLGILFQARAMPMTYLPPKEGNAGPLILVPADPSSAFRVKPTKTSGPAGEVDGEPGANPASDGYATKRFIATTKEPSTAPQSAVRVSAFHAAAVEDNLPLSITPVHFEYAWINEHGYKGTDGLHCCGWNDCMEIDARDAKPTPDGQGYSTPKGIVGNKGVYHSRDGKAWICRYLSGAPKCLFIPGGG
jgi:hypothetical protein